MKHRKLRLLWQKYWRHPPTFFHLEIFSIKLDKIVELVLANYARCHQCTEIFEKPSGHGAFCSQECYDKFADDNS